MTSRHQNREVQANITYRLDGIPPGQYTLVTTLRDKNSLKTGSFQTGIGTIGMVLPITGAQRFYRLTKP